MIWDYEWYDGLVLDQEMTVIFFLSSEGYVGGNVRSWSNSYLSCTHRNLQGCTIGFVSMDDSEANTFYNHIKSSKDTTSGELCVAMMQIQDSHQMV